MRFHEDGKIRHAVQARFSKACASVGSIFSRYSQLQCANSVQLLVRLQQAILQPCASYGCEVWAPADASIVPLRDLQSLQHTFLRRACRVKSSIPIEVVFQELFVTPWHDVWWRQVLSFWNAMAQADSESIINIVLHDAIAIAHNGCSYGWAAQVLKCFAEHGKSSPLVAGAPVEVQPDELQLSFQMQRQAAFDAVPLDPRSCPGPGVKLCTYRRWFSRPAHQVCPVYWEVPMSTAKLQRILRFRMGSHLLPIEQGRHLRLPRHRRVCRLCHTGALGDERHMLLECPALADLRDEYSPLVAGCSGVMARLVWARNQPMVSRYIIACLDRMSC